LILATAVWMHVSPSDRARAVRKLINSLKPGGLIAFTLRDRPAEPSPGFHPADSLLQER
jgi:hypothetical protein